MTALLLLAAGLASAADVKIAWEYRKLRPEMELYETRPGLDVLLWTMGTADSLEKAPVGAKIPGSVVSLRPGESRMLVLIYRNTTGKTAHFYAAPHHMTPAEDALGCQFLCLCVDEVYSVPPGRVWYRVVELKLRESFAAKSLTIMHALVGRDKPDPHPERKR